MSRVAETILNCTYMLRSYWGLLKTLPVTNEESFPSLSNQGLIHIPDIKFEWTEPKPDKYATRDCYPIQNTELKLRIDAKLDNLCLSTNLAKPRNKVGIVYDDIMLRHRNLQEP